MDYLNLAMAARKPRPRKRQFKRDIDLDHRVTLTPRESVKITRFGVNRTYDLLRSGQMPAHVVGKRFFIPRLALIRWLETGENPIKPPPQTVPQAEQQKGRRKV
jgi:hypothetical protein